MSNRATPTVFALLAAAVVAAAEPERDAAVAKQKAAALAGLKAAGLTTPAVVETDDLLVFGTVPETRLKTMVPSLQKTYGAAFKGLQFEKSPPWPGKLTVVLLSDRKQFTGYVQSAEQRRADGPEASSVRVRGDSPTVVQGVSLGEKPTDAQLSSDAAGLVATALLQARAGAANAVETFRLPSWVQNGFSRAVVLRAEGPASVKLTAHRAKSKAWAKTKGGWCKAAELWGESPPPDADVMATSLVEYMAFGPDAAKFPKFLQAFRPVDGNDSPTAATALEAAGWKPDDLDAAWKKWIVTGK